MEKTELYETFQKGLTSVNGEVISPKKQTLLPLSPKFSRTRTHMKLPSLKRRS